eukprot:scpid108488/ scgid24948/ 
MYGWVASASETATSSSIHPATKCPQSVRVTVSRRTHSFHFAYQDPGPYRTQDPGPYRTQDPGPYRCAMYRYLYACLGRWRQLFRAAFCQTLSSSVISGCTFGIPLYASCKVLYPFNLPCKQ